VGSFCHSLYESSGRHSAKRASLFAEYPTRHSAKRPPLSSVCYPGTRQIRLQWAPFATPFTRASVGTRQSRLLYLPSILPDTRQRGLLCRASATLALGKEGSSGLLLRVHLPRAPVGTRQSGLLCQVPDGRALSKGNNSGALWESLCRVPYASLSSP
jgi:hypothetical protein